jgi:hypothetical protein
MNTLKIFRAAEYSDTIIIAYGGRGASACAALEVYAIRLSLREHPTANVFMPNRARNIGYSMLETKGVDEFHERLTLYCYSGF